MAGFSSEERKPLPATFGIDIGSVSSRAFLYAHTVNTGMPVWNPDRDQPRIRQYPKHEKGDFSSKCYPFDEGLVYPGQRTVPDGERLSTSLKYAPYVLVDIDCPDGIWDQYMMFEQLKKREKDPDFREKLLRGLLELVQTIVDRARVTCARSYSDKLEVTDVVMTVPAQWTLEFEELYTMIANLIFEPRPSDLFFCTETEALANFLLRCCPNELRAFGDYQIYLF